MRTYSQFKTWIQIKNTFYLSKWSALLGLLQISLWLNFLSSTNFLNLKLNFKYLLLSNFFLKLSFFMFKCGDLVHYILSNPLNTFYISIRSHRALLSLCEVMLNLLNLFSTFLDVLILIFSRFFMSFPKYWFQSVYSRNSLSSET